MRRLLTLFGVLFFTIGNYAQEDYYGENLNSNIYVASQIIGNPSVQPPDVAAFQKVNFVPVNNYTGRAEISIPIHTISVGNMSVPISLSYNSSGVKVADMPSSVGLNWSLNAGGMISRMIKGLDDFHVPSKLNQPTNRMSPSGWLGYEYPGLTIYPLNTYNDAEPDIFSINAPGLTTKYIHERAYSISDDAYGNIYLYSSDPDPIELDHKGTIIEETMGMVSMNYTNESTGQPGTLTKFGLNSIKATGINGVEYTFATPDVSRRNGGIQSSSSIYKFESFRLDEMHDQSTNQTITFEYEQFSNYFKDEFEAGKTSYGGGADTQLIGDGATSTVFPVTQRLTKISFDGGEVQFVYGLARQDNTGDKALTEIKVLNSDNEVVKHFKLDHSYFQSTIQSTTAQSKRLRLDEIYQVDTNSNQLPGYVFTYNTSVDMPPRTSYAHDFLGYNNGSYNSSITDPTPKLYYENKKITPFYASGAIELTGNFSLEASASHAQSYILTKIEFPTGGYNEYEYELNQFSYYGTKSGGGLRIKAQKLNDAKGNQQILDYEYGTGSIANFPRFAVIKSGTYTGTPVPTSLSSLESYMGIDTFLTPQSQLEFTQGAFVGYDQVTVKDRVSNGYTIFNYKAPSPYSNTPSTKTYNSSKSYSNSWYTFGVPSLFVDRDFLRGKITSKLVYDKNDKLKILEDYTYTTKEFSTISLSYLNRSSSNSLDNCYYDNSDYKLDVTSTVCGGYLEEVELPIARDVLTTVVTTDYQPDRPETLLGDIPYSFQTIKSYTYDTQFPLIIKEEKRVVACVESQQGGQDCDQIYDEYDDRVSKEVEYPLTGFSGSHGTNTTHSLPYASNLVSQNRLNVPLKITFKNVNGSTLAKEEHYYDDFGNSIIGLEKILFYDRSNNSENSEVVKQRNSKGQIEEYEKKTGIYVTRLYDYNNRYLIAEIENCNKSQLQTALSNIATTYNENNTTDPAITRQLTGELRTYLSDSKLTSYTTEPLVGITSITDVRGYTTFYEYDNFNRLKFVKDQDGKIISYNNYHYKNQ